MKRTLLTLLFGTLLGAAGTVTAVEIRGGWWDYEILNEIQCRRSHNLGTAHVVPNQPNPCLIRTPRWSFAR